jgi:efflux transporter, outer membrane factor (OMF) lipoprotein, NodT family
MKKNKLTIGIVIVGCIFGISSCQILHPYKSPTINTDNLYRDYSSTDTTSIASVSWRIFFTDTILINLIDEALQKNVDIQIAESSIRQAEASLRQTKAAYFPTVSLTGQVANSTTSDADNALNSTSNAVRIGISSTWEADIWGKLNRQSRAQYAAFLKSQAYKEMVQASLAANVATSYYSLLALDEQLRITKESIVLLEKNVETIEDLKTAGQQNAAAVEQSRTLMLTTKLSVYDLENSIHEMENALSVLLARKPGSIERSSFDKQAVPGQMQIGVPMHLLSLRPDVKQAELAFRSAFELTNVAQASFYPSITLSSGSFIGYAASGFSNVFSLENLIASVIGGLTQPVFLQGQLTANLTIAQENQQQALLIFQNTILDAGREVSDILFAYGNSIKKNELRLQQVESTQKAVEYTEELLKANEAIYTEVLTAQQNYLSAQINQVIDKLEQLQYSVNLYRALGGGLESTTFSIFNE